MQALLGIVLPVFALIAVGVAMQRVRLVDAESVARMTPMVFVVLMGPLLFRAMARAGLGEVQLGPMAAYYASSLALFALVAWVQGGLRGRSRAQAMVHALTATFSNTAMIGIPIVDLAYGEAGLRILLPIIALHGLVMLTLATVVVELDAARGSRVGQGAAKAGDVEAGGAVAGGMAGGPARGRAAQAGRGAKLDSGLVLDGDGDGDGRAAGGSSGFAPTSARQAIVRAARRSFVHPVVLPVVAGLAWHRLGLPLPGPLDRTLAMLAAAGPTMSLLLLGASLGESGLRATWRGALQLALVKAFVHPACVLAVGSALGLRGMPLVVAAITAALPIGGNVYLFAQRYRVEVGRVSAAVALSTLLSVAPVSALLTWLR